MRNVGRGRGEDEEEKKERKKIGARGRGQCPTKGVMLIYDGDGDLIDRRGDVNLNRWLVKSPALSLLLFSLTRLFYLLCGASTHELCQVHTDSAVFLPAISCSIIVLWIVIVRIFYL